MNRYDGRTSADRRVRRISVALAAAVVPVGALGVIADSMWLLGVGAWLLIVAFLMELVYRP
ncbi:MULTISPECIES: hypothetical protein [unclassified Streptomyces]|uniref:hypothetical protein n=1 Tax=unclassified Streptomyces TaxID=2593676 RepID=UPI0006AEEA31|nr:MULTISPECIES: hypothetical protein [unclassified Streptomyces]KOX22459.1 hypothetical protein ADL06_24300 [Streptomyces sp. NRRL F-6491]KOX38776.1 hypothetical protein ADL08_26915 [Streptomyces sp. NRRL F-6492]